MNGHQAPQQVQSVLRAHMLQSPRQFRQLQHSVYLPKSILCSISSFSAFVHPTLHTAKLHSSRGTKDVN
eukprot:1161037-Pelagomonas_calceolata.AAC.4